MSDKPDRDDEGQGSRAQLLKRLAERRKQGGDRGADSGPVGPRGGGAGAGAGGSGQGRLAQALRARGGEGLKGQGRGGDQRFPKLRERLKERLQNAGSEDQPENEAIPETASEAELANLRSRLESRLSKLNEGLAKTRERLDEVNRLQVAAEARKR